MRRGMTLIEVLVALAIASVVFATVFLIYRTTAVTALRQQLRDQTSFAPAAALAALQQDISGLVPDGLESNRALKLATAIAKNGAKSSELSLCAWHTDAAQKETMWAGASKIVWRVENPGERGSRLARVSSELTGPGSASSATNFFLPGIANFRLQLHDGQSWQEGWPLQNSAPEKPTPPQTLRVEISLQGGTGTTNWSTDFVIPLGLVATSRTERAATPRRPVPASAGASP